MEFFLPSGEKRAFPRIRISLSCDLIVKETGETLSGQCLDLSTTGAKITLSKSLEMGTRGTFRLREHLGMEPFEAEVEVTRIDDEGTEEIKGKAESLDNRTRFFNAMTGLDAPQVTRQNNDNQPPRYYMGLKIVRIL